MSKTTIKEILNMHEDPTDQAFHDAIQEQLKIGKDKSIDARERNRALDNLQSTYISFKQYEAIKDLTDREVRKISSRLDRVNKLKKRGETGEE